ncbi:hypothetical protein C7S18_07785 [Ahniella affigens]|uniref:HTH araC/xylS-type domain-containing protein n=1 Tax=Ahniella affigens TaxID=2021234 RepID=A0A2P1PQK5_9GAMM|nr:helix-turn-helix domain-containing protein [Ahniella affigens]AVP97098.1 hypothetical protein C7S18_07785 [Ahniella affigens]
MAGSITDRISLFERQDALGCWRVATCTPSPALAPFVLSYWFGEGQVFYQRDRILPGGTSFLLINLGPTQYRILPGPPEQRVPFRDIWYSGMHEGPIETEAPHGNALLGVVFQSAGARGVLHVDAQALANQIQPLEDLLGSSVLALRERLLQMSDCRARFAELEHWLLCRLRSQHAPHRLVSWAVANLQRSAGQGSVERLAAEAGVSRKYLGNLFQRDVGLSPKMLARVLRFQSALSLLAWRDTVPWVALAEHCGYYDQSHLTRDFQAFSGYAPGAFVRQARPDGQSVVVAG